MLFRYLNQHLGVWFATWVLLSPPPSQLSCWCNFAGVKVIIHCLCKFVLESPILILRLFPKHDNEKFGIDRIFRPKSHILKHWHNDGDFRRCCVHLELFNCFALSITVLKIQIVEQTVSKPDSKCLPPLFQMSKVQRSMLLRQLLHRGPTPAGALGELVLLVSTSPVVLRDTVRRL